MSSAHAHTHAEVLARTNGDPTRSQTLRRRYAQRLRGQFANLNTVIRRGITERDVFRLQAETLQPRPPTDPPVFRFPTDDRKIEAFMAWLRRQERRGVLEVIHRGDNQFVRAAYAKGLSHADAALNAEGVQIPERELAALFNAPMHREALQMLYTRNFAELEGITETMNQQISRELADGFSRGLGPRAMARNVTDRVDKIGKHRATLLARTETIRTHSEATLNRFEQAGVGTVTVRAEWATAGDRRVCPICQTLEGRTMSVEEARSETFSYSASESEPGSLSGTYPIQPPTHPQCRCALLPVIS